MRSLVLLLWSAPVLAFAQRTGRQPITFDLIGVKEGLPHAMVECFQKDDRGNLWLGMQQGLAVYDGNTFIPVDLHGDGGPIGVRAITKDEKGMLWVAAEQGPIRVDPVARRAELLDLPDSLHFGIKTLWFHAVAITRPGEVLFGTNNGTYFYDVGRRTFRALRNHNGEVARTYWKFFCADTARQGVWISTHQWGLTFYHTPTERLHTRADHGSISPLIGHDAIALCHDGSGGLWCGDRTTGEIKHWDGRSLEVRAWDHVPGDPSTKVSGIWFLGRDGLGRIWGSASKPGGFCFGPDAGPPSIFPASHTGTGGLPQGSISDLYQGANGEIWLGNAMGIAIHDPAQPQVRSFVLPDPEGLPSRQRIWSMEFSGDSVLWCAAGAAGLIKIDLRTSRAMNVPLLMDKGAGAFVWDLLSRDDGLYIACADRLLHLEPGSMRLRDLKVKDEAGLAFKPGRRWLGGDLDGSIWMCLDLITLARIDPRTGASVTYVPDSAMTDGLFLDAAYALVSMKDGRNWVSRNIRGLAYFDKRTATWTDLVDDVNARRVRVGRIVGMTAANDSVLWLATDGAALVRYAIPTGTYTHFDQRHGITELGLFNVVVDGRGRVWANSDERVFCFDPVKERAIVVDPRSSTGGDAPKWTLGLSRSGLLAMNIGHEVAVFDANTVGSEPAPPAPVLTQILVDGTALDPDSSGTIVMRRDQILLEVRFGAILPPGYIRRYAVRMDEGDWSESSEGLMSLRGLVPGSYRFEMKVMDREGSWSPSTILQVTVPAAWWQTLWARSLIAVALAAGIVLLFRARLNWVRRRERAQEEQERQVNELKLQALRAQMDPHFIFNCLNSIDSFIIANDREQASHYLGRFAKLIRLILQHSDSTRVPLEREVEMLSYYLELEALRFKFPFTFAVNIDKELDGEPVELPTMLIQPYIENAIWHGLRHKTSPGHISVDLRLNGDQLECTVQDNGIGREASRAINQQRSGVHRSMGMRVSADRLRIYGELERGASRVTIHDLKDAQGGALGTRVVILIPILASTNDDN